MTDVCETIERYMLRRHFANGTRTRIAPAESLFALGVLDSLAFVELIAFIQTEFRVHIDDGDVTPDNFATVTAIAALVERTARLASPASE